MSFEEDALMLQAKGDRFREEADRWIEANPDAWSYMTRQALVSAGNGRRFGIKALCEVVRWQMRNVQGDTGFKLNNNHSAAFARRLVKEHPEVEPYLSMRGSVLDL